MGVGLCRIDPHFLGYIIGNVKEYLKNKLGLNWAQLSFNWNWPLLACLLTYFPISLHTKNSKLSCNNSQFQLPQITQ